MDADFGLSMGLNLNAPVDGDALAIVRVLPRYPNRALSRGIEEFNLEINYYRMSGVIVQM